MSFSPQDAPRLRAFARALLRRLFPRPLRPLFGLPLLYLLRTRFDRAAAAAAAACVARIAARVVAGVARLEARYLLIAAAHSLPDQSRGVVVVIYAVHFLFSDDVPHPELHRPLRAARHLRSLPEPPRREAMLPQL